MFLKLYSDKYNTVMKVSGLTLYPLHINVINFLDKMQDVISSHGHTLPEFLPMRFMHILNGEYVASSSLSRVTKVKTIYHVIEQAMNLLVDTFVRGIRCGTTE